MIVTNAYPEPPLVSLTMQVATESSGGARSKMSPSLALQATLSTLIPQPR